MVQLSGKCVTAVMVLCRVSNRSSTGGRRQVALGKAFTMGEKTSTFYSQVMALSQALLYHTAMSKIISQAQAEALVHGQRNLLQMLICCPDQDPVVMCRMGAERSATQRSVARAPRPHVAEEPLHRAPESA